MDFTKKNLLSIIIVTAIALAFVLLDFHLAKSNTNTNRNSTRVNSQIPENYQPWESPLYIAPVQNDLLSRALAKAVFEKAKESAFFNPILLDTPPQDQQYPVLLVAVNEGQSFWTPFYAQSTLKAEFAFSNNVALTQIEIPPTITLTDGGKIPAIHGRGDLEQIDHSFGLLSLPGYRQLTYDLASKSIVADVEKMVQAHE